MQEDKNQLNDFKIAVFRVLKVQLKQYPLLSLMDIYKSFFQDEFGPGHLLANLDNARVSFKEELKNMKSHGRRVSEPCGLGRCFCRVPMDLVLDGIIDEEIYFSAFINGASNFSIPNIGVWKKKWLSILDVLRLRQDLIKDFNKDSESIMDALENGVFQMNHSKRYREIYEPHYRIFTLKQQKKG